MALENLVGNKYIDALNPAWPLDTDPRAQGAAHIRGVKNVLVNQFPNLNAPVVRTADELNQGSIPAGSRVTFYNAAAPAGWSRVTIGNSFMMRVVKEDASGGGSGGSHDPILNDKVPAHTHAISGTISGGSHSHASVDSSGTEQGFLISLTSSTGSEAGLQGGTDAWVRADTTTATSSSHAHTHNFTASDNVGASNWTPRYLDMILCEKS